MLISPIIATAPTIICYLIGIEWEFYQTFGKVQASVQGISNGGGRIKGREWGFYSIKSYTVRLTKYFIIKFG